MKNPKAEKRIRRHGRIRARIKGTAARPRFAVFKSNRSVFGQIIDDEKGKTLAALSDKSAKEKTKTDRARAAGAALAAAAKGKKITKVVFDRGGFIFTGRVRAFAEGAREGGLEF